MYLNTIVKPYNTLFSYKTFALGKRETIQASVTMVNHIKTEDKGDDIWSIHKDVQWIRP